MLMTLKEPVSKLFRWKYLKKHDIITAKIIKFITYNFKLDIKTLIILQFFFAINILYIYELVTGGRILLGHPLGLGGSYSFFSQIWFIYLILTRNKDFINLVSVLFITLFRNLFSCQSKQQVSLFFKDFKFYVLSLKVHMME